MNKEMIVTSNGHQTMVAILEDDLVSEVFIERERQRGVVGNVYKGRVSKVLPGMQSAFVDIGLDRDGFLYVSDVVNTLEEFERLESGDDEEEGPRSAAAASRPTSRRSRTCCAKARTSSSRWRRSRSGPRARGSRATRRWPAGSSSSCRRWTTSASRARSSRARSGRACAASCATFREAHGFIGGVIIRTATAGRPEQDLIDDLTYFQKIWGDVRQRAESARPPAVIYREQGLVTKLLRDLLTDDYTAIRIDDRQEYQRVREMVQRVMPSLTPRVKLYDKPFPIFEEYGVQPEIEKALKSKVWLKSGGYIVVNQTEALVAIDVNTGRYVGKKNGRLEDTIVKTNLEAVKEIVRQVRLRDLGGIIVLDFIDMEEKKNRQKLFQAVELELKKDRSPSKALQVLGLRPDHHHAQAGQAEPRARADRALPVLLGLGRHQVELDDLLRDPGPGAEARRRDRRARGSSCA